MVDTSGSMASYEYALGPIAWVLSTGLREFGGRLAIALFGNGAELLSDGSEPLRLMPGIRTGGGTAFGGDAICLCAEHLEFDNPRRPGSCTCPSDGGWADTQAGVEKIHELRDLNVPVLHVSIGIEPLSVEADKVITIKDPASAMDIVAGDTVAALRARGGRRRTHRPARTRLGEAITQSERCHEQSVDPTCRDLLSSSADVSAQASNRGA